MKQKKFVLFPLVALSLTKGASFNRLSYLNLYEDDPVDEFVETLKQNSDGTTFLDDSYFMWMNIRYEWRKGAEMYDPVLNEPKLSDEQLNKALSDLQDSLTLATALPLAVVIEDEWRQWQMDPEFPNEEAIKAMGIDELIDNGYRWADGAPVVMSEGSADFSSGSVSAFSGDEVALNTSEADKIPNLQ